MNSVQKILAGIKRGLPCRQAGEPVTIGGLQGSARAWLIANLLEKDGPTLVIIASTGREARAFLDDLSFFCPPELKKSLLFFPPSDVLPFSGLSPHPDILCEQIRTLYRLTQSPAPRLIATTLHAVLQVLPPTSFLGSSIHAEEGQESDRNDYPLQLAEFGYQNVPVVTDRGQFAVRGALIDLFSAESPHPVRIEWNGDRIESIRTFDPRTQRSLARQERLLILPVRTVLLKPDTVERFAKTARARAEEKDFPRSHWASLAEKVRQGIFFSGIESYLPLFYEKTSRLWDWLPAGSVLLTDAKTDLQKETEDFSAEIKALLSGKPHLMDPSEILDDPRALSQQIKKYPGVVFSDFTSSDQAAQWNYEGNGGLRRDIQSARKGAEPLAPLVNKIKSWLETGTVSLVSSTHHQAERLQDLLSSAFPGITISEKNFELSGEERTKPSLMIGALSRGFRLPEEGLTIVTEAEIFGEKVRKKTAAPGDGLSAFSELKKDDFVVHRDHGIGRYHDLLHMTFEGVGSDFLVITYRDGDKLYLPAYRLNLLQRYSGSGGSEPRLDKMGGNAWGKVRGRAEKAIRELAGDLINLYAARSAGKGFAFSPPNELFEAFEAGFPYEETPDQEAAIDDVLKDMQKDVPMDRLVLGDVGYGKTEVALRAAFKAILDKKQVAFLVPTTLLAFQHYERFVERFRDYSVLVDTISRFRPVKEQKEVLKALAEGKVDIVVATHRLLQADVSFKDLGLLIIDEEHRFGVEQKEKVKRLKKNVDVLALSATPIPRSLHMSFIGIRAISVIETPPTDRLAVRTFVMPFENESIRESILREIRRGGQVFYVYNEVASIGRMKDELARLIPEARIEIAHGQMEEDSLEKIMIQFSHQKFDVLLCTTIIESGIDIPTANTILIHDADHFGLAQIYQLRGRVGRGNHRAYAYLLVDDEKNLTEEARKRLSVLQRFSELGSGYKMALYDLEIRGAGNLLGKEQSGHMEALGYELYTELLEKAVRELKGEASIDEIDPELHFRIPSYLPEDYIPDPPVRLELYRRLASLDTEEEIDPIEDELRDRFGRPPREVENLLELSALKTLAKRLRIKQIRHDGKNFVYAFDPSSALPPEVLTKLIKKEPKRYRLTPDFRLIVTNVSALEGNLVLPAAKKFLRELILHLSTAH